MLKDLKNSQFVVRLWTHNANLAAAELAVLLSTADPWIPPAPLCLSNFSKNLKIPIEGCFRMFVETGRWVHESGECEVDLTLRELRTRGVPVAIGARAFRVVEALVQAAGELVSKDELMQRVWPDAVVEEHTLHVHVSAVRKALGPFRTLLKTESGRGYRLTGGWATRQPNERAVPNARPVTHPVAPLAQSNLPAATSDLIGRGEVVRHLRDLMSAYRVVTLTGPGGIGKTRLALEVGRILLPAFQGDVWLIELASLSDAGLVAAAMASALGLHIGGNNVSPEALARAIGGRRLLLVVDNCEHVIDAAARMVESVTRLCPAACVLATSRERLRIEGECTYRVPPLDVSAGDALASDQDGILEASAIKLFISRMAEWNPGLENHDEVSAIAEVCRHLDGIPLAIEFAAARAATLGVKQVLAGLDNRFALLISGRRTALPKHRTLQATLDWSYDLLPPHERILLQRLSVFSGSFSLDAVNAVANINEVAEAQIADQLANLVAKSLVTSDLAGGQGYFRLLETIRIYARSKLIERNELEQSARRHAEYYRGLFRIMENDRQKRTAVGVHIDNVRAALEWCFGVAGDLAMGFGLAAVAAPAFMTMSLFPECRSWSERAIYALDYGASGGTEEMNLQACAGVSAMHVEGQSDGAHVALKRSLTIAEARGDVLNQVGLLGMLSMFEVRDGNFNSSLQYAIRSRSVEGTVENPAALALANSILGRAHQFVGDHRASRLELEASFRYWSQLPQAGGVHLGLDHHILVGIGLARNLWMQGHPAQATECVRQTIKDAERTNHPASLGLALSWAPGIFLWIGDLQSAEDHVDWLLSHAESYSLRPYQAVARGYKGSLAIRRGNARVGIEDLRNGLEQLHAMRYRMLSTEFKLALVHGLMAIGLFDDALRLVNETIHMIEANGDHAYTPEALRVKARVLLSMPERRQREAETCLVQSIDWSRRQDAKSWELRTAVDLAMLWATQRQRQQAHSLLKSIFDRFTEGFNMADLQAAEQTLTILR